MLSIAQYGYHCLIEANRPAQKADTTGVTSASRSKTGLRFIHPPVFTYNSIVVIKPVYPTQKASRRPRIPMRTIRALAKQIARKFNPDEIILFGSHAYGKPHEWSDVDLLVVMETPNGEVKTIMEISDSLPPLPFSVDIIARSRAVINKRKKSGDFFLREITEKGKVLYARSH